VRLYADEYTRHRRYSVYKREIERVGIAPWASEKGRFLELDLPWMSSGGIECTPIGLRSNAASAVELIELAVSDEYDLSVMLRNYNAPLNPAHRRYNEPHDMKRHPSSGMYLLLEYGFSSLFRVPEDPSRQVSRSEAVMSQR